MARFTSDCGAMRHPSAPNGRNHLGMWRLQDPLLILRATANERLVSLELAGARTVLQNNGPTHLGLRCNALPEHQMIGPDHLGLPEHQMALITSDCGASNSLSTKWPASPRAARPSGCVPTVDEIAASAAEFVSRSKDGPASSDAGPRTRRSLAAAIPWLRTLVRVDAEIEALLRRPEDDAGGEDAGGESAADRDESVSALFMWAHVDCRPA